MLVCVFVCANCTRDRGCSEHPVFPAPSDFKEGREEANLGRSAPRECEIVSSRHCEEGSDEAIHLSTCGAMDCFAALAMTGRELSSLRPIPTRAREATSEVKRIAHETGRKFLLTECRILQRNKVEKTQPLLTGNGNSHRFSIMVPLAYKLRKPRSASRNTREETCVS
jgi:hypothetical protein